MFYRAVRFCRETSALILLAAYILAGGAAFILMFIFPPGSLLILFAALLSLAFVVIGMKSLGWLEHRLARRLIAHDRCPACSEGDSLVRDGAEDWLCSACGSVFSGDGARIEATAAASP